MAIFIRLLQPDFQTYLALRYRKRSDLLNELMTGLQYSGLGGKRSSGYGRLS
ncbi:MAG: hypothetical protein ACLS3V_10215 [Streptococcus sp.]